MGKRSNFDRISKDQYMTIDKRAVATLAPFLPPVTTFAEPCYGQGDLVTELELYGHTCNWASDIDEQYECTLMDALNLDERHVSDCEYIISNTPWSRPILHQLIPIFSNLRPTWLLFDSDWCYTKQSSELMKTYCTDMVAVGRLIWVPGTKVSGKENCSWYLFDKNKYSYTRFHGR